jgi:hypothetical protein
MSDINEAWREAQRRRCLRANWQLYVRADAYRFAPPGTPEAKMPGWLDPSATRVRLREAQEEARARAAAEQEALERDIEALRESHQRVRIMLADVKFELALRGLGRKYSENQPRVPAGNPDGGQWTSGGGGSASNDAPLEQDQGSPLATARDQTRRSDLSQLESIANDPVIRPRIDEAWTASNPNGIPPREHGFWISRNEATGELFTRPFANPGSTGRIVPGPPPNDAIASFHTHPLRPDFGGIPGPSRGDLGLAESMGLPGLLHSHNGMYYFGPSLRPGRSR